MSDLKTDYKDDVLDVSANVKRIFNLVDQDGKIVVANVSIQDITKYTQEGDSFGAADINATNEAVNGKLDGSSTVNPMLATEEGFAADAYQTKLQLESCFQSVSNGKALVASAITDQGVTTILDATFETMANNIKAIQNAELYRSGIITALENTNLKLTANSTWNEIISGLLSLFPETLNVLAYLGISSLSISGSSRSGVGKWHYKSSGKFDITHFNTLTYVLSLSSSASNGYANCTLFYEGGALELSAGSKSIDISACKGEAYFRVGQTQVWHDSGEGWTSGGEAYLTSAKVYA